MAAAAVVHCRLFNRPAVHLNYCSVQAAAVVSSIVALKLPSVVHRDEPSPTMPPSSQPVFFVCLDVIVKGKRRLKTSMNSPLSHHRLRAAALVVDGLPTMD